jgi:hypothetical protein
MSGFKILLLLGIIAFGIGAIVPALVPGGGPRSLNWISLGLCFVTAAWFVRTP